MSNNEIIAKFDSRICTSITSINDEWFWNVGDADYHKRRYLNTKDLKYDSSYDWLIPVWIKFRGLNFDQENKEIREIHGMFKWRISHAITYSSIEEAIDNLVDGIEWVYTLSKKV